MIFKMPAKQVSQRTVTEKGKLRNFYGSVISIFNSSLQMLFSRIPSKCTCFSCTGDLKIWAQWVQVLLKS